VGAIEIRQLNIAQKLNSNNTVELLTSGRYIANTLCAALL